MTIRDRIRRTLAKLTGETFQAEVLKAIADLGGRADAVRLQNYLEERGDRPSLGKIWATLDRLEARGKVKSEMGTVRYPERGNKPRKYYQIVKPREST